MLNLLSGRDVYDLLGIVVMIPQIAIAIGVLTSNRGRPTNHFGGLDVAPGCHCRVPL